MFRLYERFVLPRIVHWVCGQRPATRQRAKIVPQARGEVLELGFGSGFNLPFLDPGRVQRLWALEPSAEMWGLAAEAVEATSIPVEHLPATAESVPLEDATVDTVLVTYTLCTVPDALAALGEARRLLRADGRLLFCEHGLAPDAGVRKWQRRLNPVWKRFGGGCHLDRAIPELLAEGGFRVDELATMYLPGWRPASFNYWGSATPL